MTFQLLPDDNNFMIDDSTMAIASINVINNKRTANEQSWWHAIGDFIVSFFIDVLWWVIRSDFIVELGTAVRIENVELVFRYY